MAFSVIILLSLLFFSYGKLDVSLKSPSIMSGNDRARVQCRVNGSYDLVEIKVSSSIVFTANMILQECSVYKSIVNVSCCDFNLNLFCLEVMQPEHDSALECKAVKGQIKITAYSKIKIIVNFLFFEPLDQIIDIQEGDVAQFNCCTSPSRPVPSISWFLGERQILKNTKTSIEDLNNSTFSVCSMLHLKGTRILQGTLIQCLASQNSTNEKPLMKRRSINILYRPSVETNFKYRKVLLGQTRVNLICRVIDANPLQDLAFRWTRQNYSVSNGSVFTVGMIESKHAAEYKCRARNTVGWSEPASSILEVVYIPSAKVVEEVVNVRLGDENVTLKCVAEHIEPTWKVNYTWTKEKAVLGDSSVYVIPLIRRSSAGVYKCIVTNSFGSSVPALVKLNTLDSYVDIEGFYRSGDEEQKIYVKCSITNQAKFRAVTSLKIIQRSTHTNILVTINQAGNIWTNRQNVYVAGNISNPEIAFLELLITKNNIICPGDFTEYFCRCVGVDKSSSPIIDESKILPIEFDESPKYMSDIQMNIKSQRIINQTLDFGTTIELVCEGDITMWDSKLQNIRWCLKIGGYGTFTPWVAHIKTINITSKSCYKMQRSIITYTVEIVNGTTEFICESGYTTMCGTGSAIAHMTVLSAKSTEPTKPQFHERAAPFPFFYISLSMLTSSLVVVIGIMIVCVIKWKISRASLKGNIRSESYKQKRAQTNTTQFGSGDDYLQPISTRRENFHEYEMIVGYTDATSDNKKKTSRCQIL